MAKKKNQMEISFETAIEKLEVIVKSLENGDLSLDESLSQFSEGVLLSQICLQKLNQAEVEIDKIIQEKDGKLTELPLKVEEDGIC